MPAVDSVNDAVQTFIRPASGGVIFAATSAAQDAESSGWVRAHPWVTVLAGIAVAGVVHAGKATSRPVVNLATAGVGAPLVSTAEDGVSVGLSLVAVFVPVLVVLLLAGLVWAFVHLWRRRPRLPALGPDEPDLPAT